MVDNSEHIYVSCQYDGWRDGQNIYINKNNYFFWYT